MNSLGQGHRTRWQQSTGPKSDLCPQSSWPKPRCARPLPTERLPLPLPAPLPSSVLQVQRQSCLHLPQLLQSQASQSLSILHPLPEIKSASPGLRHPGVRVLKCLAFEACELFQKGREACELFQKGRVAVKDPPVRDT